jgi:hypothetical protein
MRYTTIQINLGLLQNNTTTKQLKHKDDTF